MENYEKRVSELYKAIIETLTKQPIQSEDGGYTLNAKSKRDAVVAAYHLGITMSRLYNVGAKMGDTDVQLPSL